MILFRSEEHVTRSRQPGATIPVSTSCDLGYVWWAERLAPRWTPHTRELNAAILRSLGLVNDFWTLPSPLTLE